MSLFTAGLRARPTLLAAARPALRTGGHTHCLGRSGFAASRPLSTRLLPGTPRARRRLVAVLSLVPLVAYYLSPRRADLSPQVYSDHPVSSVTRVGPAHVEVVVPLDDRAREMFAKGVEVGPYGTPPRPPPRTAGEEATSRIAEGADDSCVVVQHVMVKNPQLMIERPYTPVNDAAADGEMRMVVKRVRGGEVGRLVHSLKAGDEVGLRGPVTTFAIRPDDYDTVVMISTGTAVAPFLQLLAKTPTTTGVRWKLLHQAPATAGAGANVLPPAPSQTASVPAPASAPAAAPAAADAAPATDWTSSYIAPMQTRWGSQLDVRRVAPGAIARDDVTSALDGAGRVLVLVCLPTPLMRPLCGALAPTLHQGPLVGILAELGLRPDQVWKLE